ncbi:MAG: hypothetical protein OEO82_08485 [Gammaproteobacteria bacterium]|nr:hypothetical protein [Gammaproteobacteria bacterium]
MPELTAIHFALLGLAMAVGLISGWVIRSHRSHSEKSTINEGWKEQFEAQRNEHQRLIQQNKSLMEQNSQYQASNRDSKKRAGELSTALQEAFARRDELQRKIKDIRGNLEVAVAERQQLQSAIESRSAGTDATSASLQRRDETIKKLSGELQRWQERVPPLIEKFRARNEEATQLEEELQAARAQIHALETMMGSDQTRVEPVDAEAMLNGLDASNDSSDTSGQSVKPDHAEAAELEASTADDHDDAEDLLAEEDFKALIDADDACELRPPEPPHTDDLHKISHDDLQLIKGIGPAIEKTLIELGICRFDQIAAMSEYDIDRVAKKLKGFRSRVYRENWIDQARDLHDQKHSGQA